MDGGDRAGTTANDVNCNHNCNHADELLLTQSFPLHQARPPVLQTSAAGPWSFPQVRRCRSDRLWNQHGLARTTSNRGKWGSRWWSEADRTGEMRASWN
jgi:hypothetical protein